MYKLNYVGVSPLVAHAATASLRLDDHLLGVRDHFDAVQIITFPWKIFREEATVCG